MLQQLCHTRAASLAIAAVLLASHTPPAPLPVAMATNPSRVKADALALAAGELAANGDTDRAIAVYVQAIQEFIAARHGALAAGALAVGCWRHCPCACAAMVLANRRGPTCLCGCHVCCCGVCSRSVKP